MKQMVGGMKLTMTEEVWLISAGMLTSLYLARVDSLVTDGLQERAAKKKVVLPYEHRGNSSIYQADDFRQYLPPAAGGAGAGAILSSTTLPRGC